MCLLFKPALGFGLPTMLLTCCVTVHEERTLAQYPQPTARVVGHVFCLDTNAPARLASITLRPVPERAEKGKYKQDYDNPQFKVTVTTDFNGAFAFEHVEAGGYYIIADLPGYLNQALQFTEDELARPTADVLDLVDRSFTKIRVEQGSTTSVEIPLQRGAAVSGSIRFDDASPAVGVSIQLFRFDADAKPGSGTVPLLRRLPFAAKTDDLGRFRIAGLPAGGVILKCTLRQIRWVNSQEPQRGILDPVNREGRFEHDFNPEQTLDIYSGGVFRQKDATPIKLVSGAEFSGADIVIPLDKIHQVSGVVTSFQDGHAVNDGKVELLYANDGTKLSESKIGFDGTFHFAFVPKGEYQLSS